MGKIGVIVVAAGRGTRMGAGVSKQFLLLAGKPILAHTLHAFESMPGETVKVVVTGQADMASCCRLLEEYRLDGAWKAVAGGEDRQASVYRGLSALPKGVEAVLIHDGVRPFIRMERLLACLEAARAHGAAVLGVRVKDTIKEADEQGTIVSTPPRSRLWAVQTPQAFRMNLVLEAHRQAEEAGFRGTDDAMLVERLGRRVHIVEGDYSNIKITTPEDLEWAAWQLGRGGEEKAL